MPVKYSKNYYVKLPKNEAFLKEWNGLHLDFARFIDDATSMSKEDAIRIAKLHSLEVIERLITITTEDDHKTIYRGE